MTIDKAATRAEIDILYAASNKLTQASTPAEQLDAVSDYAREQGASSCVLLYIDNDASGQPEWLTVVAEWTAEGAVAMGLDQTFYMPSFAFNQVWLSAPNRPTLVEDALSSDLVDRSSRANYMRFRVRGMAMLPLNIKGRWVGLIMFAWSEPHVFDERDRRIFTALIQQAGPVIDSMRLFEQTQKRAAELEAAKHEIDLLYAASNRLTQSMTPDEWLAAVSDYALAHGASTGVLFYVETGEGGAGVPESLLVAAEWRRDVAGESAVGKRFGIPDYDGFMRCWLSTPDRPTLIEDVLSRDYRDPTVLEICRHYQMRATAILPLNSQGRWIGLLMFAWTAPVQFEARDRRIYTALQQQATPVIDAVRLFEATRERAYRAELLLDVNDALSRAETETDLVAAVALYAARHDPASIMLTYIDVPGRGSAVHAVDRAVWRQGEVTALGRPEHRNAIMEAAVIALWPGVPRSALLISDIESDSRLNDDLRSQFRAAGWQALVVIPLHSGFRWQGVITIAWSEAHAISAEEEYVFQALVQRLSSVVTSRRAYLAEEEARRETEARARELETVAKVSAAATTRLNVDELLHTVCSLTQANFNLQQANVYLLDEAGERLKLATDRQASAQPVTPIQHSISIDDETDLIARAARERRGLILNLADEGKPACSEMAVPMVLAGRLIGVLYLASSEAHRFTEADIQVMGTLTDLIAVAVENARLYEKAQALAVLEERARLARELHDSVSQALYGIGLGARTARMLLDRDPSRVAEPLDYVLSQAEAGLTEMRALIFQLRPESIENEGLVTVLAKQASSMRARHGIQVSTELCDEPELSLEIKQALYLVAREALHNTVKHAQARHVNIGLECCDDHCRLEIEDDGIGFDPSDLKPGHYGLHTMAERVAQVKGEFSVDSAPGRGTTIRVVIPTA